jgi:hypothetical protein
MNGAIYYRRSVRGSRPQQMVAVLSAIAQSEHHPRVKLTVLYFVLPGR